MARIAFTEILLKTKKINTLTRTKTGAIAPDVIPQASSYPSTAITVKSSPYGHRQLRLRFRLQPAIDATELLRLLSVKIRRRKLG